MTLPKNVKLNQKHITLKKGFGGYCLSFVRQCWLKNGKVIPAVHRTAYLAWLGVKASNRHERDYTAPAGVPVFFAPKKKGQAGHVAFSVGNGKCITTNSVTNTIYTTTIKDIESSWGQKYLGWTEAINGHRVYSPPKPSKKYTAVKVTGRFDRVTVSALQDYFGLPIKDITVTVSSGRWTTKGPLVVALQKKFKTTRDGVISTPRSALVTKMQKDYKLKAKDGYISYPYSSLVAAIQKRLRAGTF